MRESRLLDHIAREAPRPSHVLLPSGDDMAALAGDPAPVLAGVDQLVAGRHFDPVRTSVADIAWKAMARSVSDVAAMAGRPTASLVAVTLPAGTDESEASALFDAVRDAANRLDAPLVGGDIAVHAADGPLVLSVTVLGVPGPAGLITRSGARPGDTVAVTGRLGGSLEPGGGGRHLSFEPRVAAGLALATELGEDLHAMLDLSDGLGRDAARLARASGVGLQVDADRLPRHDGVDWRGAVGDGEDHELLFTCRGAPPAQAAGVPITVIGTVTEPPAASADDARVQLLIDGRTVPIDDLGWDHAGDGADAPPRSDAPA